MLFTNIRIEAPSDRPSPLQMLMNAAAMTVDAGALGCSLLAPYRLTLMMYRMNRALTAAMFMR